MFPREGALTLAPPLCSAHRRALLHRGAGATHGTGSSPDPPRPAVRLRQARDRRLRARPRRAGRRGRLHRRHRAGARERRPRRPDHRRSHRLPGDHGRPRQDAASQALRRPARGARQPRARARRRPSTTSSSSTSCASTSIPFERTAARAGADEAEVIENIDIGGPTMIRAAAKNHAFSAVVVHPESYDAVLEELREADGTLSHGHARGAGRGGVLLHRALRHRDRRAGSPRRARTSRRCYVRAYEKVVDLPYGENPHQRAAFYSQVGARTHVLARCSSTHGKQLVVQQHPRPRRGARRRARLRRPRLRDRQAQQPVRRRARRRRPGGLPARVRVRPAERLRRRHRAQPPRRPRARPSALAEQFVEVLFAPGFDDDALEVLAAKPNMRILEDQRAPPAALGEQDIRQVTGGLLVQDRDSGDAERTGMEVVTERPPTEDEWRDLLFAWQVCRHVKSNAIVLARDSATRRHRRRADEPRRLGPPRGREVAPGRPQRRGAGLRRLLPVRRRPRAGHRGRA